MKTFEISYRKPPYRSNNGGIDHVQAETAGEAVTVFVNKHPGQHYCPISVNRCVLVNGNYVIVNALNREELLGKEEENA